MRTHVLTATPILATIAAAGWLVWSHLGSSSPPTPTKSKFVGIDASLLDPVLGARSNRDPFQLPGTAPAAKPTVQNVAVNTENPRPLGLSESRPAPEPKGKAAESGARALNRVASFVVDLSGMIDRVSRAAVAEKKRSEDVQATLSGQVRLSATSIQGKRRMAVLNDRIVQEGEAVPGLGSSKEPVRLTGGRATSVVLQHRGALAVVTFPSLTTATGPPPTSRASATPATASRVTKPNTRRDRRPSGTKL